MRGHMLKTTAMHGMSTPPPAPSFVSPLSTRFRPAGIPRVHSALVYVLLVLLPCDPCALFMCSFYPFLERSSADSSRNAFGGCGLPHLC